MLILIYDKNSLLYEKVELPEPITEILYAENLRAVIVAYKKNVFFFSFFFSRDHCITK